MGLLKIIRDYRLGRAEPGSIAWDTLLFYWKDAAEWYANDKLFDRWLDTDQVADLYGSSEYVELEREFFDFYLKDVDETDDSL